MKYKKAYLERLYSNLYSYSAIAEIFQIISIVVDELSKEDKERFKDLIRLINWEARSTNSGVWTYYEVADGEVLKGDHEVILKYNYGLGKFRDDKLMGDLDNWIYDNEDVIHRYFGDELIKFKLWVFDNIGA